MTKLQLGCFFLYRGSTFFFFFSFLLDFRGVKLLFKILLHLLHAIFRMQHLILERQTLTHTLKQNLHLQNLHLHLFLVLRSHQRLKIKESVLHPGSVCFSLSHVVPYQSHPVCFYFSMHRK